MDWGILLLVLLVLACPVSMMWMMRRGRGAKGDRTRGHDTQRDLARGDMNPSPDPTDRLSEIERRQAIERGASAMEAERRSPKDADT